MHNAWRALCVLWGTSYYRTKLNATVSVLLGFTTFHKIVHVAALVAEVTILKEWITIAMINVPKAILLTNGTNVNLVSETNVEMDCSLV